MEKTEGADRRRITEILLTYGWHGVDALADMIRQTAARDIWRDYMCTMLYGIGKMLASQGWDFPTYRELIDFEGHTQRAKENSASAQDTIESIKAKLKGGMAG